ncbi:TPA: hypothetical protein ACH3X1_011543 [Trebouxia sp. C0004]
MEEATKQHRNYCAVCKACGTEMHGKPERMKRHIIDCKRADHADQLHTLHKQAGSLASESGSQPQNETAMDRYVNRVRVTPQQKAKWQYLLAMAFILAGLAFRTGADAALMALNNPANTTADNAEAASTSSDPAGHAAATKTADSMELCSTAELVELFAKYTEADEQQKREDYLVSECRLIVDIDFADESLDWVTDATVPVARVALGDNNVDEEYDLDKFVSRD